jgi:hypothetical protein
MALQMNYKLAGDFDVTAYVRIESVNINYAPNRAIALKESGVGNGTKYIATPVLEVKSGKNKNRLEMWNGGWVFAYDHTSNQSPIQQAYAYLKTLPEFSVITDLND